MSVPIKNPTVMVGGNRSSGGIQTYEFSHVRGGERCVSFYSGAVAPGLTAAPGSVAVGSDVLVYSGAGRLNSIIMHTQLISGIPVLFYDAGVPVSGGPIYTSGHKVLAVTPGSWSPAVQGSGAVSQFTASPFNIDMPFQSGLCFNSRSGQPGFTVSYTVEVNTNWPNA